MNVEYGLWSRRTLNILLLVFFVVLAVILLSSERGVSGAMERLGGFLSNLFG
jgi:HAMP domain-containing protein